MDKPEKNALREMRQTFNVPGSEAADRLVPVPGKPHRVKVFKSGNSLALRLPKALGLEAGMELDIEVLPNGAMELRRTEPVKRKFDIDKVAGSATSLRLIDPDDRWFEERTLDWGDTAKGKSL
jgi:antitoxin VapB